MEFTSFDLPKKAIKDTYLKKFLVKNDPKESANAEINSNLALSKSLEQETPRGSTGIDEKKTKIPPKPYLFSSNKQVIDLTKDGLHAV